VRRGLSPQVNALATLVVAMVTLGILAAALVSRNARRG
jgi:ABC-type spermidine/putrescine transport system permease subunit II